MERRLASLLFIRCFASAAGKDEFDSNRSGAIPERCGPSGAFRGTSVLESEAGNKTRRVRQAEELGITVISTVAVSPKPSATLTNLSTGMARWKWNVIPVVLGAGLVGLLFKMLIWRNA